MEIIRIICIRRHNLRIMIPELMFKVFLAITLQILFLKNEIIFFITLCYSMKWRNRFIEARSLAATSSPVITL